MNRDLCILEKNDQAAERKSEGEENKLQLLCEQCLSHSWDCFRGYSRAGYRLAKMEVGHCG